MLTWAEFADAAPDLAAFGARLLTASPAYLATVRSDGAPRVHPVTPIIGPAAATAASAYAPADRYILFELLVIEAFANAYGDGELPSPSRWKAQ